MADPSPTVRAPWLDPTGALTLTTNVWTSTAASVNSEEWLHVVLPKVLDAVFDLDCKGKENEKRLGAIFDKGLAGHVRRLSELHSQAAETLRITLAEGDTVGAKGGAGTTGAAVGEETRRLQVFAEQVVNDIQELDSEQLGMLDWKCETHDAPWELDGAKIFKSEKMDEYVDAALAHKVRGKGMGMTQRELFEQLQENDPSLEICIMGGFVRDAVRGMPGNDIDMSFLTDPEGMKRMGELAARKKWTYSDDKTWCDTYNEKNKEKIEVGAVKAEIPRFVYIHFGDNDDKRDVEGKCLQNSLTRKTGWGCGEFTCNDLFYSLEHKVIIDLTGLAVADAQAKRLRIPYWRFLEAENPEHNRAWQLDAWEEFEGYNGIYRWCKFRGRDYEGADNVELLFVLKVSGLVV
jgi:hypothetical protein